MLSGTAHLILLAIIKFSDYLLAFKYMFLTCIFKNQQEELKKLLTPLSVAISEVQVLSLWYFNCNY